MQLGFQVLKGGHYLVSRIMHGDNGSMLSLP
jgi:hypothetical protein